MNFLGALELLQALGKFYPKTSRTAPKMALYDAEKDGYTVWVNENSVKPDYLCFMNDTVKTRQLRIRKHEAYLVIQSS
jgi:hypothetical protein